MNAIIFGGNGQDSNYLKTILNKEGVNVICISRNKNDIIGDVSNRDFVFSTIKSIRPDFIFHFAAKSSTQHQFLYENHNTISLGTINILEAVRLYSNFTKVFLSGSAMQFQNLGLPIDENTPFEASSPYSISRIQSTFTARYYRSNFGLKVYVGYFFNHDSPFRSENHINQKIVRTVQRISNGSGERLKIGDINVQKEFNYAEDFMFGVWKFVNQDHVFEVVIGSGKSYSISTWLEICFTNFGLDWKEFVDIDKQFIGEYNRLVSKPNLINSIGWKANTSIDELAQIMLLN